MGKKDIFAARLRDVRLQTGKTQKEFADMVGSTPATISAYENATKNPSLEIVMNIANKCNISIDWLCGLSDKKHNTEELETYSDLFKSLFEIGKHTNMRFSRVPIQYDVFDPDYAQAIFFEDELIDSFLEEWEKMKSLHDEKVIDDDVYNLWIEKIMIKDDHTKKLENLIHEYRKDSE